MPAAHSFERKAKLLKWHSRANTQVTFQVYGDPGSKVVGAISEETLFYGRCRRWSRADGDCRLLRLAIGQDQPSNVAGARGEEEQACRQAMILVRGIALKGTRSWTRSGIWWFWAPICRLLGSGRHDIR